VNLRSVPCGVGKIGVVPVENLDVARQLLDALAGAAKTGDREALYPLLAPDVEWSMPQRDLRGLDDLRDQLTWVRPPDNLDVEFDELELTDRGDGRVEAEVRETYRLQSNGQVAYIRRRRIELTIRDGKITRYEMRMAG
jgi:ketosteroid isomerase-like protein